MNKPANNFENIAEIIKKENRKIMLFGAGVIGTTTAPAILNDLGLTDRIVCYLDNDKIKQGETVELYGNSIPTKSPEILKKSDDNIVIFVNASHFNTISEQLSNLIRNRNIYVYNMPELCIYNFKTLSSIGVKCDCKQPLIPKKIHYIWIGSNNLPEKLQKCIDSWKKFCPDFEIVKWDDNNYDFGKCFYMKTAYENKKYGFAPDYARIDIIYRHGGIYLDTDVEIIKPLSPLLYLEAFCGVEKWQVLNFGVCGSVAGNKSLIPFLKAWEKRQPLRRDGSFEPCSSGIIDTKTAIENGYRINGKMQTILNMNIYPFDYFQPYDYMTKNTVITENTFTIHHFNGGW